MLRPCRALWYATTSASAISLAALTVTSSGSPGPSPTPQSVPLLNSRLPLAPVLRYCLDSRSLRSSLVPRCDPHSRSSSGTRPSLRSSLAVVFGYSYGLLRRLNVGVQQTLRQPLELVAPAGIVG